jgi:hypothetical protein
MKPIWRLRWSGDDEVGATGGHVDQQLEDNLNRRSQWAERKRQIPILKAVLYVIFTS